MKRILNSSKGFGIIEVLLAFALLGTGAYIALNAMDFIEGRKRKVDKSTSMISMISSMLESIRSNIAMEKIDFNADKFLALTTAEGVKDSLRMCWVRDGIIPIDLYPNCPGRIGYVVTPMKTGTMEIRGLYLVTIRLTHDKMFPGEFKQYEFIVRSP